MRACAPVAFLPCSERYLSARRLRASCLRVRLPSRATTILIPMPHQAIEGYTEPCARFFERRRQDSGSRYVKDARAHILPVLV